MQRSKYDANPPGCKYCGGQTEARTHELHPGGGVYCINCGRHQFWLAKDRAESHRPALKRGTTEQVWKAWGNHCASCGLSAAELDFLGIGKTVQHAPPFKDGGHDDAQSCDWCQQHSASQMKRLQTLVNRLRGVERPA